MQFRRLRPDKQHVRRRCRNFRSQDLPPQSVARPAAANSGTPAKHRRHFRCRRPWSALFHRLRAKNRRIPLGSPLSPVRGARRRAAIDRVPRLRLFSPACPGHHPSGPNKARSSRRRLIVPLVGISSYRAAPSIAILSEGTPDFFTVPTPFSRAAGIIRTRSAASWRAAAAETSPRFRAVGAVGNAISCTAGSGMDGVNAVVGATTCPSDMGENTRSIPVRRECLIALAGSTPYRIAPKASAFSTQRPSLPFWPARFSTIHTGTTECRRTNPTADNTCGLATPLE